jgi:hypothetical protein
MLNLDYRFSMNRSVLILLASLLLLGPVSCASKKPPPKPEPPPFAGETATLSITNGIHILSQVPLPLGFAPAAGRSPMWLQNGQEIGIVGKVGADTVVLGYGGQKWQTSRVLAADTGPNAAEQGRIVDVAPSPDGMTLAIAEVIPGQNRLDIVLRDLIAVGPGNPIASFDGEFDSATLAWLNNGTVALALRAHPEMSPPPAPPPAYGEEAEPPPKPAESLQLIVVTGTGSVAPLDIKCPMSPLSWSANAVFAVGSGDREVPPIIIDRRNSECRQFGAVGPIRVLDWDEDEEGTFLYIKPDPMTGSSAVYRYNIDTGHEKQVAISTGAAAFTSGGTVIVEGNQSLTLRMAAERPNEPLHAQIAISQPEQGEVQFKPLGFDTTPPMLAASSLTYSETIDAATIQTFAPGTPTMWRKIINYSIANQSAFLLATGAARGVVDMSWSIHGRWLAIVDGDQFKSMLTVIVPPQ